MSVPVDAPDFEYYAKQDDKRKKEICRQLLRERFGDRYELISVSKSHGALPTVRDSDCGLDFKLVFPMRVSVGLSESEEAAVNRIAKQRGVYPLDVGADWSRPVFDADVGPMLVSSVPVLARDYLKLSSREIDVEYGMDCPLYIGFGQAEEFCREMGGRLPSEIEWECICRGGTGTAFFWNDDLPPETELEKYLYLQEFFSDGKGVYHGVCHIPEKRPKSLHSLETRPVPLGCNPFGFYALFAGEWCSDRFRYGYDSPPVDGEHVVRGGASLFWPWQDEEWIWCLSSIRTPESHTTNRRAAFRLAVDASE